MSALDSTAEGTNTRFSTVLIAWREDADERCQLRLCTPLPGAFLPQTVAQRTLGAREFVVENFPHVAMPERAAVGCEQHEQTSRDDSPARAPR